MYLPLKKLTIVILSYNTSGFLRRCLESVEQAKQDDWQVMVVDNASTDDSVEMVKREFPWVSLLENKKNLGFSAGNNVALRKVKTPYVMLLNSDAEFMPPYSLQSVWELFEDDRKLAVVTPKVVLTNGSLDWGCHRGVPTPWNAFTYFANLEHLFRRIPLLNKIFGGYHQVWKDLRKTHEIDVCSGAAMIVRMEATKQVGLLDERYKFYGEDIDWCFSFKKAGWKVMFHPAVTVLHHKNVSGIKRKQETKEHKKVAERSHALFFATMSQFYEKQYLHRYPRWVGFLVKQGIGLLSRLERSQLWLSPRKQRRK